MRAHRPLPWLLAAATLALGACGGSGDAWRAPAERACATGTRDALAAARRGGTDGLRRAGTALTRQGRQLTRLDGPDDLTTLARTTGNAGRALTAYARTGDAGRLRAARRADARATALARTLDLPGCIGPG